MCLHRECWNHKNQTKPVRKNIRKPCSRFTGVFTKPVQAACTPQSMETLLRKLGNKHSPVLFQWGAELVCWLYLFIVMNYLQVFPKRGTIFIQWCGGGFPEAHFHPKKCSPNIFPDRKTAVKLFKHEKSAVSVWLTEFPDRPGQGNKMSI